jgi:hypothetical protein
LGAPPRLPAPDIDRLIAGLQVVRDLRDSAASFEQVETLLRNSSGQLLGMLTSPRGDQHEAQ